MTERCEVRRLHFVTYENGMRMQESLVAERQQNRIADQLLLLQHFPVITLGRAGRIENLLASEVLLERTGVEFHETTRGGDITYHGPGQIVGYPIIHLGEGRRDIRKYVWKIEEVLIRTAATFGITAERVEGKRGIWVGNAKLAAIGVRIARWVTSHGFAFNVDPDLSHFELITPCGLHGTEVTSLRRLLGEAPAMDQVLGALERHFADVFERETVTVPHDLRVAKVLVHDGSRVLLLHRKSATLPVWQPVTGGVEEGETFADAAERELREETGLGVAIEPSHVIQSFAIDPAFLPDASRPLLAEEETFFARCGLRDIEVDRSEHDAYGWFPLPVATRIAHWSDDRTMIDRIRRLQP